MGTLEWTPIEAQSTLLDLHAVARRAAREFRKARPDASTNRLELCRNLLQEKYSEVAGTNFVSVLRSASKSERHYLVGALYVLLMPAERRRKLAAYFTPPFISKHVISQLLKLGFKPNQHRALDPACGGAAFLVPIAERMIKGLTLSDAKRVLASSLTGIEIEPGLAALSDALIADVLGGTHWEESHPPVVRRDNALKHDFEGTKFDLVVSNPPYGRVFRASSAKVSRWRNVVTAGHVNTYALFIGLALEVTKGGALIALVVPTSFVGGPHFENLRREIRGSSDVLRLDLIEKRSNAFMDVTQDTCILFLRKRKLGQSERRGARYRTIDAGGVLTERGRITLSKDLLAPWVLPAATANKGLSGTSFFFDSRFSTLKDYGYEVRSGYFVWNRSLSLLRDGKEPSPSELPLIWAHNIRPNRVVQPMSRRSGIDEGMISFVSVNGRGVLEGPAIVLQRTTNRRQSRRLVAGHVPSGLTRKFGGYVMENHTIAVVPIKGMRPAIPTTMLMRLLNSQAVDDLYRRVSGTATVSTRLLRHLPLPPASLLKAAAKSGRDFEAAVESAYVAALEPKKAGSRSFLPSNSENLPAK